MTGNSEPAYTMTVSLNVLKHLGIGLYSNVPAVLSEAVANAWDADAGKVEINIDPAKGIITIRDDGHGMSVSDANQKYLEVGYERRKDGGANTPGGRVVMGRKGVGKLSLFSIAKTVEVHSAKDGERHGFKMEVSGIEEAAGKNEPYHPVSLPEGKVDKGTYLVLTDMNRRIGQSIQPLRRRLSRRFSIIGAEHGFAIELNDKPVTVEDRGYHDKLQYIWTFGKRGKKVVSIAKNLEHTEELPGVIPSTDEFSSQEIDGWIGTVRRPRDLKDPDTRESINGIVIMVRGKLAQENILDEFGDENLYSQYVIGEIHADFLDLDTADDIATTNRQKLIEDDPRYQALKETLGEHLKAIQIGWRDQRNKGGKEVAATIPQIEQWYAGLNPDQKKNATKLFGRINQLPFEDDSEKRRLFIGGILAFESLRFRNSLNQLDKISTGNLSALSEVFAQLDDLEQSAYYQVTRDRLEVIRTLTHLVDENAKERALQEHLYHHLWLLDPSWERATHTAQMERRIHNALEVVYSALPPEERGSRLDIYYATTGNKHVIVELKRANRVVEASELSNQIQRYHSAARAALQQAGRDNDPLEFVCVLGRRPREWDITPGFEQRYRISLAAFDARVVMYDSLIDNAQQAYQDYVNRHEEAGRVYKLIRSIAEEDIDAMSPGG